MSATIGTIIGTALAAGFGLIGVWRTQRASEKGAKVTADAEVVKTQITIEDRREERLEQATEAHFKRIERALAQQQALIEEQARHISIQDEAIVELRSRIESLEDERRVMIAWMAFNKLGWPPPPDWRMMM